MMKKLLLGVTKILAIILVSLPFSSATTIYYPSIDTLPEWYENESQAIFVNEPGYPQSLYSSTFTLGILSIAINVTHISVDEAKTDRNYDIININVAGLGVAFNTSDNSAVTPQYIEIGAYISSSNNGGNPLNNCIIYNMGYGSTTYGAGINVSQPNSNSFIQDVAYESTAALSATAADYLISPYAGAIVSAAFIAYHMFTVPTSSNSNTKTTGTEKNCFSFNTDLNNVFPSQNFSYSAETSFKWYIPYNYTNDIYTLTLLAETRYNMAGYYTNTATLYVNLTIRPTPPSGTHGGGSCVYGYEPILMANGVYKFAKDIKVADQLMTYNFSTESLKPGTVADITITNESQMYIINGDMYLAPDQNIWTDQGWIKAANITYNETVNNVFTNNWYPVYSIVSVNGTFHMYDFTIAINGNYIALSYIMEDKCTA